MGLLQRICKQKACYWSRDLTSLDSFGQTVHIGAVEIDCRWEDVSEEVVMLDGTKKTCSAKVFLTQDVSVDGFLCLGTIGELVDINNIGLNPGAFKILRFEKIPDMKAKNFLRIAYL